MTKTKQTMNNEQNNPQWIQKHLQQIKEEVNPNKWYSVRDILRADGWLFDLRRQKIHKLLKTGQIKGFPIGTGVSKRYHIWGGSILEYHKKRIREYLKQQSN